MPIPATPPRILLFFALCVSSLSVFSCRDSDAEANRTARSIAAHLDDRTLAAQVLMTGIEGSSAPSPASAAALREVPAGAVMLFKYNLGKGASVARGLTDSILRTVVDALPQEAKIPPFVAVDHEGGPVYRLGADATHLPAAASFGALGSPDAAVAAEGAAYRSARELRALGITLNLAPVAEVSDDQSGRFLGARAYGRDPALVADAASGFVLGMARGGVACVVKHFPGNAAVDPHLALPTLQADQGRLDLLVSPFVSVFRKARPAAVMVSHVIVPSLDPSRPASLSPAVIEGYLRKTLGFRGMVVSDDLRMGAIASTGRNPEVAAVEAVAAGVDLVMTWTRDLVPVRDALVSAVADGRLSRSRLEEAAARVIAEKIRARLYLPLKDSPGGAQGNAETAPTPEDLASLKGETENYLRSWRLR